MSEQSTPVSSEHYRYVAAHTTPEDEFLQALKREARAAGIPSIWIAPEQAAFMQILLRLCGAREVIEVGTLAGYSGIAMARALPPGGRVRTIEIEPRHADFAEGWIARSDVADRIQVLRGDGREILPSFASNSADAVFIDADKLSYSFYMREAVRIVSPGGLIMVDNAFAFGQVLEERPADAEAVAICEFNEDLATIKALQGIIVPFGDGLWVAVKRAAVDR